MARRRRNSHRKERSGRFMGLYIFLSVLIIAAVIVAGCIVFFRVSHIKVEGIGRYTSEEIVAASGVTEGDNLFLVKGPAVASSLLGQLPYVKSVHVQRRLPDTLVIQIEETTASAKVQVGKAWWLMSLSGKWLEEGSADSEGITITGLTVATPKAGSMAAAKEGSDASQVELPALLELLPALNNRGLLEDVNGVDCSSGKELVVTWQNRLKIKLLMDSDFESQGKLLKAIIEQYIIGTWSDSDSGTLDMTYDDGNPHLSKDK